MKSLLWRSLLFIPANNANFIEKAQTRGADAYILDLEDAVASKDKSQARSTLSQHSEQLYQQGLTVVVRINADLALISYDLEAINFSCTSAIVVPKLADIGLLNLLHLYLSEREVALGLANNTIRVIGQIESVKAMPELDTIASHPRVAALAFGTEDFAATAGMQSTTENWWYPCQQMAMACHRHGIVALGYPGSMANFRDEALLIEQIQKGRDLGFTGALCIHPAQVALANKGYQYDNDTQQLAREIVELADNLNGDDSLFAHKGLMVDAPMIRTARYILAVQ